MIVTLESGDTLSIQGGGDLEALEEGQDLFEGCVLQINGLGHERVADGRRLREQDRDPRAGLLAHFCTTFSRALGGGRRNRVRRKVGGWEADFAAVFPRRSDERHGGLKIFAIVDKERADLGGAEISGRLF